MTTSVFTNFLCFNINMHTFNIVELTRPWLEARASRQLSFIGLWRPLNVRWRVTNCWEWYNLVNKFPILGLHNLEISPVIPRKIITPPYLYSTDSGHKYLTVTPVSTNCHRWDRCSTNNPPLFHLSISHLTANVFGYIVTWLFIANADSFSNVAIFLMISPALSLFG